MKALVFGISQKFQTIHSLFDRDELNKKITESIFRYEGEDFILDHSRLHGRASREDDRSSVRDLVLQVLGDRHGMGQTASPLRWNTCDRTQLEDGVSR